MFRPTFHLLTISNRYLAKSAPIRCCSTSPGSAEARPQLLPSQEFLMEAHRRGLSERLSRVIAEIEVGFLHFRIPLTNSFPGDQGIHP